MECIGLIVRLTLFKDFAIRPEACDDGATYAPSKF